MNGIESEWLMLWMLPRSFSILFSDAVIDNLFSNIQGEIERECERQEVPPSSTESEQSISFADDKLQKYLEKPKKLSYSKENIN